MLRLDFKQKIYQKSQNLEKTESHKYRFFFVSVKELTFLIIIDR